MAFVNKTLDSNADFSTNYTGSVAARADNFDVAALQISGLTGASGNLNIEMTIDLADPITKQPKSTAVWTQIDTVALAGTTASHVFNITVATATFYRITFTHSAGS